MFSEISTGITQPDWERILPAADHRWVMGLRRGLASEFFAPSESASTVLAERAHWLSEAPHNYAALLPAAESACAETIAFARTLGAELDPSLSPWDQMLSLGRVWEADFVWMQTDSQGTHRLAGGVVCFPSSWALHDKLGLTMSEVHSPVPGLNLALDRQIETFFQKMLPDTAWCRENIGFSRVPDLNQHPLRPRPLLDATVTPTEVWVRLEHQLLLKLPASLSILFAIRVEVLPFQQVLASAEAKARLARYLATLSETAADYKQVKDAREVLLPLLRAPSA